MQEIELEELAFCEWMILAVGYAIVLLGLLQILLNAPAVLIEFADAIVGIRNVAVSVEFECPL